MDSFANNNALRVLTDEQPDIQTEVSGYVTPITNMRDNEMRSIEFVNRFTSIVLHNVIGYG